MSVVVKRQDLGQVLEEFAVTAKQLPPLSDLTACPHCGGDQYYVRYQYRGSCKFHRLLGDPEFERTADNALMYDEITMIPGKVAYCSDCYKPIARYEGEFEPSR